jgi:hypothetical protein
MWATSSLVPVRYADDVKCAFPAFDYDHGHDHDELAYMYAVQPLEGFAWEKKKPKIAFRSPSH